MCAEPVSIPQAATQTVFYLVEFCTEYVALIQIRLVIQCDGETLEYNT